MREAGGRVTDREGGERWRSGRAVVASNGAIHGALFVGLCWMFVRAIEVVPIPRRLAAWGVVGAIVPFGPFVVDRWLRPLARAT